jgi:amino acid permease
LIPQSAPKYYYELKDRSFERFNIVVNASFFCAGVTYVTISSLGFLTFGEHSAGFILDNYSNHDRWASASRMGVALAVLFSYPLVFLGAREGWVALMVAHAAPTDAVPNRKLITVVLLATITALAILVPNLTFVLSFSGATLSSCIIYIFPSLMFQALVRNCSSLQMCTSNWKIKESVAMMWMGVGLGICGAVVSVVRTYF